MSLSPTLTSVGHCRRGRANQTVIMSMLEHADRPMDDQVVIYQNDISSCWAKPQPFSSQFPPPSLLVSSLLFCVCIYLHHPALASALRSDAALMAVERSSPVFSVLSDVKYPVVVLFVLFVLFQQWRSYRRLSQFKGPFWAGITSLWMARSVSRRRAHLDLYETYLQYGTVPSP